MNKALILAVPMVLLAACAMPAGHARDTQLAAASASGTQYCKRDRLFISGDTLTCTWSSSISEACESTNMTELSRTSVAAAPASAGRCGNGQWLVSVTRK